MADYYSILKKTVSGLPSNTPETRRAVYAKARAAIDRQLRSINPPPSEDAIARQMGLLEQAISEIDEEFAPPPSQTQFVERSPQADMPVPPSPSVTRPVPPAQEGQQRPVSASQTIPVPPLRPQAQPAAPQPDAVRARPVVGQPAPGSAQVSGQLPGSAPRVVRPVVANVKTTTISPASRSPGAPAPGNKPVAPQVRTQPSNVGKTQAATSPAYDSSLDELDNLDRAQGGRAKVRQRASVLEERSSRSGRFAGIAIGLLVVLAMAGGGYALWRADVLNSLLGGDSTRQVSQEPAQTAPAAPEPTADNGTQPREVVPQESKENVRLGQDGQTVEGEPLDEDPGSTPLPNDNETATQASPPEAPASVSEPAQTAQTGEVRAVDEAGANGSAAADATAQAPADAGVPAIAQKAYLYEEGTSGAGATRDNAAIVWSLGEEAPADGLPPEAVIRGQLDVPGRGLVMQLTIKRNVDEALPASHIIELIFTAPEDFSGGNVDNIARFVMKSNEQARGEGLVAVPAKIDTGYFLIALNNLEQAEETNRKLLLDSEWIDIPLGYTSGRRALVTLEKGAIGDKVFNDAFADWDKR